MITWNTTSGSLGNVAKGQSCNIALSCVGANTFSIIAGSLPTGLTLTGPHNQPTLPFPSIFGNTSVDAVTGPTVFTIRAADYGGNISDRGFALNVLDVEPSYLFPSANLGVFPDGKWLFTSVAPLIATPHWPKDMQVIAGSLPPQVVLNSETGNITGYVNPSDLYNTGNIYPNAETGAPNLPNSANTKSYAFTVQYDSQNTANYSITIQRQDQFANANANVSGPCYHAPIFIDATHGLSASSSNIPNIDLGMVDGDSIFYQFRTEDYEGNTTGYTLVNANSIPGNIVINPSTGWMSGYINRDLTVPPPYEFQVIAYKSAAVFSTNNHPTTAYCTLKIENPSDNSIVWNTDSDLGNLYPGIPSSLSVAATIIEPFTTPAINKATANCSLKLVGVTIVDGGNAFANGSIFTVPGGISANSANIIVSNITPSGTISEVIIDGSISQEYTKLPPALTVIWTNPTGNANALNAIFGLDFGVDKINVLNAGGFYDTATVGFSPAGESNSAIATSFIFNGTVSHIDVDYTGNNYQAIPEVIVLGKTRIEATNPIKYEITEGTIPSGCKLLSNGLIVGLPSTQYFALGQDTPITANQATVDTEFNFTITASIGQNRAVNFTELDLPSTFGSNVVVQDFQTLTQLSKDFNLTLVTTRDNNISNAPKTNLSMEFLLDDTDMKTLYTPLLDESIVPNGSIYRQDDFYFGIAPHVRILLAYGISPEIPDTVQEAIERYFHNKNYLFNNLKWAQSTSEGYEVIYIEPLDDFTNQEYQTFTGWIEYNTPTGEKKAFPATTPNMINQLNTHLNGFDYNFLPSWMRDIQPDGQILGYVPAIPLVYVKPGTGKKIQFYLQKYYDTVGPSLQTIQAVTDRLVWNTGFSENWDSRPRVILTAKNITAQISGVAVSGPNANYAVIETNTGNAVPVGTDLVIQGMTNPVNNGKFPVTASTLASFQITNANAIAESNSAGYAYSLNLVGNSSFTINPAAPLTYTPNLTPRTYAFTGNVTVNLPANITNISNIVTIINSLNINGIQAGVGADSELFIENIYGCPFFVYDGSGTPLANLGLLPSGNLFANVSTVVGAGWWTSELTEFDDSGNTSTEFTDIGEFFDVSDEFLQDDEGSMYIKYPRTSFIDKPIVTV